MISMDINIHDPGTPLIIKPEISKNEYGGVWLYSNEDETSGVYMLCRGNRYHGHCIYWMDESFEDEEDFDNWHPYPEYFYIQIENGALIACDKKKFYHFHYLNDEIIAYCESDENTPIPSLVGRTSCPNCGIRLFDSFVEEDIPF